MKDIENVNNAFLFFKTEWESCPEVCQYLGVWLKITSIIRNDIAAEPEENWIFWLPLLKVQCWYLPNSIGLSTTPIMVFGEDKVVKKIPPGNLLTIFYGSVQDRLDWFCGIRCDMKLEQTIQKVSKGLSSHFVAGEKNKKSSVPQFELLNHEIVAITNLFQLVTSKKSNNRAECNLGNHFPPASL